MEDDNFLIKKYLDGEENSLKMLIDKHTSSIYNFSKRFTDSSCAEDITQDVFIKVWKNIDKFNFEKSQFKTWLFTIARNTITDYLRKKKYIAFSNLDGEESFVDSIEDENILPDEVLQRFQDKELLLGKIEELPDNYKTVLTLYYVEDMTFKDIGEVLNKPLNTVKSYHYRALSLLRDKMAF